MNLSQLRALVAVADTGSITGGAARLGLTQSGASQAVAALEERLGIRLVLRMRRGALPVDRRGLRVLRLAEPLRRRFGLQASAHARTRKPPGTQDPPRPRRQ